MPLPSQTRTDQIYQQSWQSGMITSLPPEELPNDAAQLLENVEFDANSNLVSRNGVSVFLDTSLTNQRITSLFRAQYSDGTVFIYFTSGTQLYRCTETGASLTNITGALVFPNDTFWQWVMYNDFAVGGNGGASDGLIKIPSTGTPAAVPGSSKYIEVWNSRLWAVATGNTSVLFASNINSTLIAGSFVPDNTDSGPIELDIDIRGGDFITGIKVFRGSLYIYKRRSIYVISAISAPATIPSNLRVDQYTKNLGCESAYSIQNVIDDQVFLSSSGVASLSLAPLGDLKGSLLSRNLAELQLLKKTSNELSAIVLDDMNQYWLSIPSNISNSGNNEAWVLDYEKVNTKDESGFPIVRWVKMTGLVTGTAYTERLDGNYKTYLIAGYAVTGQHTFIYQYTPNNPVRTFNDNSNVYIQRVITKAYTPNSSLLRTLWHRFGGVIRLNTNTLNLFIFYYFNNQTSAAGDYTIQFTSSVSSPIFLYGSGVYGTATYSDSTAIDLDRVFWRQFRRNANGRKARTVALELRSNTVDQGFTLKFLQVENTLLNFRRARGA